jgi:hypothetical protein
MENIKYGSRDYKKLQDGNQMEIKVLTRVPMKGRHYHTSYSMQKRMANVTT